MNLNPPCPLSQFLGQLNLEECSTITFDNARGLPQRCSQSAQKTRLKRPSSGRYSCRWESSAPSAAPVQRVPRSLSPQKPTRRASIEKTPQLPPLSRHLQSPEKPQRRGSFEGNSGFPRKSMTPSAA
ncbi:expressed unknown protein [Seminavis robusta]|uniref:Uncharacterized protein n=1 Tax=Seminavis robusta TaxID=568900 RepID=A0A9N8EQQ9_9STRA|nr:expressed unknown protein [Seminavis robusta]|eukprot:Sro1684_g291030.1 n/a (127) ;mRNA; f:18871-19251